MEDNKLQVAPEKSEAVVIAGKKKEQDNKYKAGGGGQRIEIKESEVLRSDFR